MNRAIAERRLDNQGIASPRERRAEDVVAWLGAVQAQEYPAAKWALALRMHDGVTDAEIDQVMDEGRIIRTHVMRPTWHFVPASDLGWMLALTSARVHRALAYANRYYELSASTRTRAACVFERALRENRELTRGELGTHLARARIKATGIRLALLTIFAEVEGVICSGPTRQKQMTYALLARRVPKPKRLSGEEALAELTKRYVRSHGPATIRDFVWWSGLTSADARRGLDMIKARQTVIDGLTYWSTREDAKTPRARARNVHLLPIYDEYLVAYRDRAAVRRFNGAGGLQPSVVIRGQVVGSWRTTRNGGDVSLEIMAGRTLTQAEQRSLKRTVALYETFVGT